MVDETMMNTVSEEQVEEEVATSEQVQDEQKDELKEAIEAQMRKLQRQNMLIGAQTACHVILEKILVFKSKQGKPTMNDYKRLVKDIEGFCKTGVSRKINADGEAEVVNEESSVEETVQN